MLHAHHAPALNTCVLKARPPQDLLRQIRTETDLQVAATTEATTRQEVRHRTAATTAAVHRRAVPQVQVAVPAAATVAGVAAQVRAAAIPAQAAIALAVAEVAVQAVAEEEDKKIRLNSNKKTTFAVHLQGSFFI